MDLAALRDAIEATFAEVRFGVENEWVPGPTPQLLVGGHDVALSINPVVTGLSRGGLTANVGIVWDEHGLLDP